MSYSELSGNNAFVNLIRSILHYICIILYIIKLGKYIFRIHTLRADTRFIPLIAIIGDASLQERSVTGTRTIQTRKRE